MSESRVAIRYAKSLLELAQEHNVLEKVKSDMDLFNKVCKENRGFVLALQNPIIKHDKKNDILKEVFKNKVSELTLSFFDIISRKHREAILPFIAQSFHTLYNQLKNIIEVQVATPFSLPDELRKQFQNVVKDYLGKEIELREKINKDLIGGYVLTIHDRQIDESVASKLADLRLAFSHNPYIKEY